MPYSRDLSDKETEVMEAAAKAMEAVIRQHYPDNVQDMSVTIISNMFIGMCLQMSDDSLAMFDRHLKKHANLRLTRAKRQ